MAPTDGASAAADANRRSGQGVRTGSLTTFRIVCASNGSRKGQQALSFFVFQRQQQVRFFAAYETPRVFSLNSWTSP